MDILTAIDPVALGAISGLVIGIVQIARKLGLTAKYAPLAAVGAGIALAGLQGLIYPSALPTSQAIGSWLLTGIAAGLTASGLYSVGAHKVADLLKPTD